MTISEDRTKKVDPIGLYVIASTQLLLTDDYKHTGLVVQPVTDYLARLFAKKGYLTKPLNAKVKKSEVFKKYSFYFHIDEKRIAKAGKNEGCSSVLIAYLAYTGKTRRLKNGLKVYRECSLYGWLVDTTNGKPISSSHAPLYSFDEFLEARPASFTRKPDFRVYRNFLEYIAFEMFNRFPRRTGNR
jgi:hypothetical protein